RRPRGRRRAGRRDRISRGAGSLSGCRGRPMSGPLLQLEGVHTHIGAYHILHGVDLEIARGELTVLLGRNGAGKTTTLRSIMGLWHVSSGAIRVEGGGTSALETPEVAPRGGA